MRDGFDLLIEGWLPTHSGQAAGIHDLFTRAHDLDDIVVSVAPAASGLWRFLTVIAARVTGLDEAVDFQTWEGRRESSSRPGRWCAGDLAHAVVRVRSM